MTSNPSTLLAPAISAFPKYGDVLGALATLMAGDAPAATPPPSPAAPPPMSSTSIATAATILAGRFVMLGGNGVISDFDFGDGAAPFNALRGYNAAHVYDKPGSYVASVVPAGGSTALTPGKVVAQTNVTVVADTRPQVTLAVGADLAAALARITAPTVVLLPAGATFELKAPVILAVDGVTLRAGPAAPSTSSGQAPATNSGQARSASSAPAPCIRRIATPGSYSTLVVSGSNIGVEGVEFDSDQPLKTGANAKVGVYAINVAGNNLLVRNCTFRNVDDGLHCEPHARGLVVIGCQFTNELRGCGAYLDAMQNAAIIGITAAGSVCEHIVRFEGAQNVLIHGSDADNHDGKETIAIRAGACVAVTANVLRAWARISQGIQAAPAIYCKNILFASNHFSGLRPGGSWMQVNPGSQSVVIDSNAFDVDAQQVSVAVQAPVTDVSLTHNQLCLAGGVTTSKTLVAPFGNPLFTETGTTTIPAAAR